jgi:hypothetical protein
MAALRVRRRRDEEGVDVPVRRVAGGAGEGKGVAGIRKAGAEHHDAVERRAVVPSVVRPGGRAREQGEDDPCLLEHEAPPVVAPIIPYLEGVAFARPLH